MTQGRIDTDTRQVVPTRAAESGVANLPCFAYLGRPAPSLVVGSYRKLHIVAPPTGDTVPAVGRGAEGGLKKHLCNWWINMLSEE